MLKPNSNRIYEYFIKNFYKLIKIKYSNDKFQ